MSGYLINNNQIKNLVNEGVISISPNFDISKLQIAQYPLFPFVISEVNQHQETTEIFRFDNNFQFSLKPKSYYIVDILENIKISKGIIGRFIPSSNLIEKGILLNSGKIEHPYGQNNEKVRFGVYNCLDFETIINATDRIAYIQFFDLRGQKSLDYNLTEEEKVIYNRRVFYDADAPNYERDQ